MIRTIKNDVDLSDFCRLAEKWLGAGIVNNFSITFINLGSRHHISLDRGIVFL